MRTLRDRYGPWAIVTGASSGMGVAFAQHLGVAGINLVLVARREDRLRALAHRLRDETGVDVRVVGVDLSRPDSLSRIEATTEDIEVGLVVNNAGGAAFGPFMEGDISAELRRMNVNVIAPMRLARTYGPAMRERRRGGIIFERKPRKPNAQQHCASFAIAAGPPSVLDTRSPQQDDPLVDTLVAARCEHVHLRTGGDADPQERRHPPARRNEESARQAAVSGPAGHDGRTGESRSHVQRVPVSGPPLRDRNRHRNRVEGDTVMTITNILVSTIKVP